MHLLIKREYMGWDEQQNINIVIIVKELKELKNYIKEIKEDYLECARHQLSYTLNKYGDELTKELEKMSEEEQIEHMDNVGYPYGIIYTIEDTDFNKFNDIKYIECIRGYDFSALIEYINSL